MAISLLEPEPSSPPNPWPRRLGLALIGVLVVGSALYFPLRHYPEKRHVARFFEALVQRDFHRAYQLWKPKPSFSYQEFLSIWGPKGDYGPIRSYEIVSVESSRGLLLQLPVEGGGKPRTLAVEGNPTGLVVHIRVNNLDPPIRLWVERKDKSLSFPPF